MESLDVSAKDWVCHLALGTKFSLAKLLPSVELMACKISCAHTVGLHYHQGMSAHFAINLPGDPVALQFLWRANVITEVIQCGTRGHALVIFFRVYLGEMAVRVDKRSCALGK